MVRAGFTELMWEYRLDQGREGTLYMSKGRWSR